MAILKPEDLMVGDWFRFRYKDFPLNNEVVLTFRIERINDEIGYVWSKDGRICKPERLEPIPLTPEILEKNGFEKYEQGGEWVDMWMAFGEGGEYDIEVEFRNSGMIRTKVDGPTYLNTCDIKYLHQLQHCLRIVGIDKEIIL